MMSPWRSSIYDRKVTKNIERVQIASQRHNWRDTKTLYIFDKRGIPRKLQQGGQILCLNKHASFKPITDASKDMWVRHIERRDQYQNKRKNFEVGR